MNATDLSDLMKAILRLAHHNKQTSYAEVLIHHYHFRPQRNLPARYTFARDAIGVHRYHSASHATLRAVRSLRRRGFIEGDSKNLHLTPAGVVTATRI
jgi:hypothetical protein